MITHSSLDNSGLDKIGVWETVGEMGAKMAFVGVIPAVLLHH